MASRLSKILSDKYNVFIILFDKENQNYDFKGELVDLNLKASSNPINKLFIINKRLFKLNKIIRSKNISAVFSFTTSANYSLCFSAVKCKKIISCRGFEYLYKSYKLLHIMTKTGCEILFNSKEMEKFYLDKYPEDLCRAHTIYNIFDIDNIVSLSEENLNENENNFFKTHHTITTVSHFSPTKGHWNLIKAFEILKETVPDSGLVLIGYRGELEAKIKEMAAGSRYSKDILFVGFQSNPFKYIAKSDIYALCSVTEGFPNALVEAMICKVPVVAVNCISGPSEILFDTYHPEFICNDIVYADYGILTPPFGSEVDMCLLNKNVNHKIYAKAIENILTDNDLKNKYAEKARERGFLFGENLFKKKYMALIDE
jgi:glycosyltransferase involved in cell wall biosynthesis